MDTAGLLRQLPSAEPRKPDLQHPSRLHVLPLATPPQDSQHRLERGLVDRSDEVRTYDTAAQPKEPAQPTPAPLQLHLTANAPSSMPVEKPHLRTGAQLVAGAAGVALAVAGLLALSSGLSSS